MLIIENADFMPNQVVKGQLQTIGIYLYLAVKRDYFVLLFERINGLVDTSLVV